MSISTALLNRLRKVSAAQRLSGWTRYGLAAAALGVVAAVQASAFGASAPFFLYTPAVAVVTLLLGGGAGVSATAVAAVAAMLIVREPGGGLILTPLRWTALAVFVATTLFLVGVLVALRTALLEADATRTSREAELAETARREAFTAGVLASSTDCIKVLDLDGRLTFMSEGGMRVMEVSDFGQVAACPWPDFWTNAGNAEAVAAVEAARRGETRSFVGRAATMKGTPRWWHVAVSPIAGPDGRPERILSVSRDITDLRESEEERDRFVRLAENSRDFVGMAHLDGRVFYMNDAARRMVGLAGVDLMSLSIADFFPAEQVETVAAEVLPAVDRDGHWAGELTFRHFGTGELIPVLYSVFPITGSDGARVGYGTVTRDFRDRKAEQERLHLLNGEMAHRLKNTLSVVQAIASQTLAGADPEAVATFGRRLVALSAAHEVLLRRSWGEARLGEAARGVLATFDKEGQIAVAGPEVTIGPRAALSTSLLLHELATNAVKYGALSVPEGRVTMDWTVKGDGVHLCWAERGGPPAVPPTRRGFGSRIIRMGLSGSGGADLRYEEQGLTAEFTASSAQLREA